MDWNYNGWNYTLKANDGSYYVSYLPGKIEYVVGGDPRSSIEGLREVLPSDAGQAETALVVGNDFFILNGDFRKEYEEALLKGLAECKSVFLDNQSKKSSWSN